MGSFFFGYELSVLNTSQTKMATHFGWDPTQETLYSSWINGLIPIGGLFGALLAGQLAKMGRRFAMFVIDYCSIVGVFICLFAI